MNTTRYDNSFSSNETYPDYLRYTLTTNRNYTSVLVENSIHYYRVDSDVQRYDNTGTNCLQSSVLHHPKDGEVYKNWEYYFKKALLNQANTTGLYYSSYISPNNGWITWTQNITYIICSGVPTDNLLSGIYGLTIEALNQSNNALIDVVALEFYVSGNRSPKIGILNNVIIEQGNCKNWSLGNDIIEDESYDTHTTSILINESATLPIWLTYDPSNYTFSACGESHNANVYNITFIVDDNYNVVQDHFIIVIVTDHNSNETSAIEDYVITMNQYFDIQLPPVDEIFNYSMNETITPYLFLTNTSMFPNFLIFDNIK